MSEETKTTMNIGVPPEALAKLKAFCDKKMVKQRVVLSRLMTWFVNAPPVVQSVVTGTMDEGMEYAYAAALRALADQIEKGAASVPPPDSMMKIAASGMGPRPGKKKD